MNDNGSFTGYEIIKEIRKKTKPVNVGGVIIGGGNPVVIQSMCNTDTKNVIETSDQINRLEAAGCEAVRVAVPDAESAAAISEIKKHVGIPVIADIHFDYKLAIRSIFSGADKIRINPGNIGGVNRIEEIIKAAKEHGIPIRIGVNSGSLEKDILKKYGKPSPEALVESALRHIGIFEERGFGNIVVSIKSSSVPFTVSAYRELSSKTDYPLHVGITEAGSVWSGGVKSAVGIGAVLSLGIGDTIRVSLTGDPVEEIRYAREILKSLELRRFGVEIISCPTCARTKVDLEKIVSSFEARCVHIKKDLKVAIMGCAVNGPGEAREADAGIAFGNGYGALFARGKVIGKYAENEITDYLFKYIEDI